MALIKCPECGREKVSDSAEMCPDCGYGIKAHFERIRIEEERKESERKSEELRNKIKIEEQKRKEEQIKSVPKPSKPRISIVGSIISGLIMLMGIILMSTGEYERQKSIDNHNGDPVVQGVILLIFGISILCFVIWAYYQQRKKYNLAQTDFEEYQRTIVREHDEEIARRNALAEAERYKQMNAPKCPVCGSTNIEKISTTSRAISVATVGLASGKIGKQNKCKNCKHMW